MEGCAIGGTPGRVTGAPLHFVGRVDGSPCDLTKGVHVSSAAAVTGVGTPGPAHPAPSPKTAPSANDSPCGCEPEAKLISKLQTKRSLM